MPPSVAPAAAPSLGADALRAKPRKKPRTATLQVGRVVFLRPGRLPGGASPHQPHLILEETWPLRGDRGCRTTRHFRLQPQPSGEPFLLEEDAVTALHNGFRDAWLAMEAAGDVAQRETLLRALAWYCEECARPPLACIRLLLHSGAVSREQALELACPQYDAYTRSDLTGNLARLAHSRAVASAMVSAARYRELAPGRAYRKLDAQGARLDAIEKSLGAGAAAEAAE